MPRRSVSVASMTVPHYQIDEFYQLCASRPLLRLCLKYEDLAFALVVSGTLDSDTRALP